MLYSNNHDIDVMETSGYVWSALPKQSWASGAGRGWDRGHGWLVFQSKDLSWPSRLLWTNQPTCWDDSPLHQTAE